MIFKLKRDDFCSSPRGRAFSFHSERCFRVWKKNDQKGESSQGIFQKEIPTVNWIFIFPFLWILFLWFFASSQALCCVVYKTADFPAAMRGKFFLMNEKWTISLLHLLLFFIVLLVCAFDLFLKKILTFKNMFVKKHQTLTHNEKKLGNFFNLYRYN